MPNEEENQNICPYCKHSNLDHQTGKCAICGCPGAKREQATQQPYGERKNNMSIPKFEIKTNTLLIGILIISLISLLMSLASLGASSALSKTSNNNAAMIIQNVNGIVTNDLNGFGSNQAFVYASQASGLNSIEANLSLGSKNETPILDGISNNQSKVLSDDKTIINNQQTMINGLYNLSLAQQANTNTLRQIFSTSTIIYNST